MRTLIIYDSFFGNTEQIAQAIGNALGSPEDVEILRVSCEARTIDGSNVADRRLSYPGIQANTSNQ